jgi:RimJ/RimL family protein N-acetyltransferase
VVALVTQRLSLRPACESDFELLVRLYSDEDFTRHTTGKPLAAEDVWVRLLRDIGHWQVFGYGTWHIWLKDSEAFIGSIGILSYRRTLTPPITDPELGWGLDPAFHGKGYGLEALERVLDYADSGLKLPQTFCMINPANAASMRLAKKTGFSFWRDGLYRDHAVQLFRRAAPLC